MASFDDRQPIFQQVAHMIEDDILNGTYHEDDQVLSVAQFSRTFQINPATVVKGIGLLVDEGILYKKRGLGMYVATDAKAIIVQKRRDWFFNELVTKLIEEARKLNLTADDIVEMIRRGDEGEQG